MERWMARCMARASLVSFCALAISLTCFLGAMQWRAVLKREVDSAHRGSKQFEHLYREALDHSAQWKEQFDRERDRGLMLAREAQDALAQARKLQQRCAENELLINSLVEARNKVVNEAAAAQALARERGAALAESRNEHRLQREQLEEVRGDLQVALEAFQAQKEALEACGARMASAQGECDARLRRVRQQQREEQDGRAQLVHDAHAQEVQGGADINGVMRMSDRSESTATHAGEGGATETDGGMSDGSGADGGVSDGSMSEEAGKLVVEDVARHGSARRGSEMIRPEDLPHVAEHAKHWRERGAGLKKGQHDEEITRRGGGGAEQRGEAREARGPAGEEGLVAGWSRDPGGDMREGVDGPVDGNLLVRDGGEVAGGEEGAGEEEVAGQARQLPDSGSQEGHDGKVGSDEGQDGAVGEEGGREVVGHPLDEEVGTRLEGSGRDEAVHGAGVEAIYVLRDGEVVRQDADIMSEGADAMRDDDDVMRGDADVIREEDDVMHEHGDGSTGLHPLGDEVDASNSGEELAAGLASDDAGDGLPVVDYGDEDVPAAMG
eukprot:jgi/Mesvir1/23945/Mv10716-RA.1